jgi:hypothetical protein
MICIEQIAQALGTLDVLEELEIVGFDDFSGCGSLC